MDSGRTGPNDERRQADLPMAEQRGPRGPLTVRTPLAVILDEVELQTLCRRTDTPLTGQTLEARQNAVRAAVAVLVRRELAA